MNAFLHQFFAYSYLIPKVFKSVKSVGYFWLYNFWDKISLYLFIVNKMQLRFTTYHHFGKHIFSYYGKLKNGMEGKHIFSYYERLKNGMYMWKRHFVSVSDSRDLCQTVEICFRFNVTYINSTLKLLPKHLHTHFRMLAGTKMSDSGTCNCKLTSPGSRLF